MNPPPKASQRYDLVPLPDGLWTVMDLFTGLAAVEAEVTLEGLELGEADDLVDLLNARERERIERDGP